MMYLPGGCLSRNLIISKPKDGDGQARVQALFDASAGIDGPDVEGVGILRMYV
jgi:hypothetical protein